jgi:hypothetical protein
MPLPVPLPCWCHGQSFASASYVLGKRFERMTGSVAINDDVVLEKMRESGSPVRGCVVVALAWAVCPVAGHVVERSRGPWLVWCCHLPLSFPSLPTPHSSLQVTFQLWGDSVLLWQSEPVAAPKVPLGCSSCLVAFVVFVVVFGIFSWGVCWCGVEGFRV